MTHAPDFLTDDEWSAIIRVLRLSQREGEILPDVMAGHSETEIAKRLGISPHTVHTHFERLHRKLQVVNRSQLVTRIFAAYTTIVHASDE